MKKQFAIIGVGRFGLRVIEELSTLECEILAIDIDPHVIDSLKGSVDSAFVADASDEEVINRVIPSDIDATIVDLGDNTEVSFLVTNYLSKMGVVRIVARAGSDAQGEILRAVGATDVVFPSQEAARRITPMIAAPVIFSYIPLSARFILSELQVPKSLVGTTLSEADQGRNGKTNVFAYRAGGEGEYHFAYPELVLQEGDTLLVAGDRDDVQSFSDAPLPDPEGEDNRKGWNFLSRLLRGR